MLRYLFVFGVLMLAPARAGAGAEWQVRPFIGGTFAGATTFALLDQAPGSAHLIVGGAVALLGNVVGVEADVAHAPFFFIGPSGPQLVVASGMTTVTGNVIIALPKHMTQYTLRPYFVGGGGLMHAHSEDALNVLAVNSTLGAVDLGGGVTGFLTERLGLNWELRYFRSVGRQQEAGLSFGAEQVSFWRATMAFAVRY